MTFINALKKEMINMIFNAENSSMLSTSIHGNMNVSESEPYQGLTSILLTRPSNNDYNILLQANGMGSYDHFHYTFNGMNSMVIIVLI